MLQSKFKVLHIITNLDQGGAERQLLELLEKNKTHEVCQLLRAGYYDAYLSSKGTKLYSLNMKRKVPDIRAFYKLKKIISISKPQIIHCWMYHSCLLEILLRKISKNKNISLVWGLRCSNMDLKYYSFQLNFIIKACKYFSNSPNMIINNSFEGKKVHDKLGFNKKSIVIPNGINVKKFSPNNKNREKFRKKFGINNNTKVFLCVARLDPMKDHATLLSAFNKIKLLYSNVVLVLAGLGTEKFANEKKVISLGAYENINHVYNASDIIISSSAFGEGFSNALGEGMASGLIPISTNVGDARKIIGNTGEVISPMNKDKLYRAIRKVMSYKGQELLLKKEEARSRIIEKYSKEKMILSYKNIYNAVLRDKRQ